MSDLIASVRRLRDSLGIPQYRTKLKPEEWVYMVIELYANGCDLEEIASEIGLQCGAVVSVAMRGVNATTIRHRGKGKRTGNTGHRVAPLALRNAYIALVEERHPLVAAKNAKYARREARSLRDEPVALASSMEMWRNHVDAKLTHKSAEDIAWERFVRRLRTEIEGELAFANQMPLPLRRGRPIGS